VAESAYRLWLVGFADPTLNMPKGAIFPIDIVFDGRTRFHVTGTATTAVLVTLVLPDPAVSQFRKSHLMVFRGTNHAVQFTLSATDNLVAAIENCVSHMTGSAAAGAGDFSVASKKSGAPAKPAVPYRQTKTEAATATPPAGPPRLVSVNGTGFLISKEGQIVTNNHVIKDCVSDVQGNFIGQPAKKLRIVATDETNDLALLQAKGAKKTFKEPATLRETPVQSGDEVVAIGFPFHGLLTSDFTVTTGTVSSLSGILNDTRFLQISAPVQPGNSGGPLLDMSGHVVGVVSSKLNALKFAKATGDIPENINFALKTGTVRDFLDNSVVPYGTEQSQEDLKAADIASAARSYIMLITCTASEREAGGK
jgi:S1-C subfamily serine protease